jgi:hypothetical protein
VLTWPVELVRPPPHHPHALLPEFSGMGIGATDFLRLPKRKLMSGRIRLPRAAFVQER